MMMVQPQRVKLGDMSGQAVKGPGVTEPCPGHWRPQPGPPRFPLNTDGRAHFHASDSCCTEGLGCVPRALSAWTGSQPLCRLTSHQALASFTVMAARKGEDVLGRRGPPSLVPGGDVEPGTLAAPVVPSAGPAGWGTMQAGLHIPYLPHLHICEGGLPSAPHLPFWVCHYHSTKTFGIPATGPTSRS